MYIEDKDIKPPWKGVLQNYFQFPEFSSFSICFINKSTGNPNYTYTTSDKKPIVRIIFTNGDPEKYSDQTINRSEFYGIQNYKEYKVANAGEWCFPYLGREGFSYRIAFIGETGDYDIQHDDRWWRWYDYKVTRSTDYKFLTIQFLLVALIWMLFLESVTWSFRFIKSGNT